MISETIELESWYFRFTIVRSKRLLREYANVPRIL